MPHAHDHRDHHDHAHGGANFGTAFAAATVLNLGLVAAQIFYGLAANSVALLADAGHNFGDALGLVLAWGGYVLSRAAPTERFTYGFRSASILSALINAILLLVATGAIAWEAILRLGRPQETNGLLVMAVAGAGIVINGLSAWLLMAGRERDLNIRSAFAHLAADAGVSAGVVIAGAVLLVTRWTWVDPVASLLISVAIVWGTWGLLRESVQMSMDAVPQGISITDVRGYLENLPGVAGVHDLHIWAMSTTETALTVHLVCRGGRAGDAFLMDAVHELDRRFGIHHATIQIEAGELECRLAPTNVV
ncbi:MAG: cation diffusion facilitator family transporter [Xanthobacteraceae bacterium]